MPKSILDKDFKYVSAANTNLRKTFARIRREMTRETMQVTTRPTIVPIRKKK